jgi:hypothetical protein
MTYKFWRFDIREPGISDTSHLREFNSDDGKYVEAAEAMRRDEYLTNRVSELQAKLDEAHAIGSKTEHVRATELFAKLRKVADEAWPKGPLRAEFNLTWAYPQTQILGDGHYGEVKVMRFVNGTPQFNCTIGKAEYEWRNAAFFEAASPEVVLFLLDHINYLGEKLNNQAAQQ